jgi:proline utilization trans-activator
VIISYCRHGKLLKRFTETFLPWDLDCLSVSTISLIVARFVDQTLLDDRIPWLRKAYDLLNSMINGGNRIADFRKRELRRLEEMLAEYSLTQGQPLSTSIGDSIGGNDSQSTPNLSHPENVPCTRGMLASPSGMPLYSGFSDEGSGFGDDLTAEQILAVADSMNIESSDWLSFAVMDNYHTVDPHIM